MEKKRVIKKVLLTGISGFVGSHVFEHIMKTTDWDVVGTYRNNQAGSLSRIQEILEDDISYQDRLTMLRLDLQDRINSTDAKRIGKVDAIVHMAANSHVDRSITNPLEFVHDNIDGCVNILEYVRKMPKEERPMFYYFGTDEVFGPAPKGVNYTEEDRHRPNNPYAACKSAAEQLVQAYHNTYGMEMMISNCMNIIGERQDPEKYVGLVINKVLNGDKLSVHSSPEGKPGTRHYLHARNIASAVCFLLEHGVNGERYNVVGDIELDNLEFAKMIAKHVETYCDLAGNECQGLNYELTDFHSSRPGHDLRYALDGSKIKELGFSYPISFEETLKKVVYWTLDNRERWL